MQPSWVGEPIEPGPPPVDPSSRRQRNGWWLPAAWMIWAALSVLIFVALIVSSRDDHDLRRTGKRVEASVVSIDDPYATVRYSSGGNDYETEVDMSGSRPPLSSSTTVVVLAVDAADPGSAVPANASESAVLWSNLGAGIVIVVVLGLIVVPIGLAFRWRRRRRVDAQHWVPPVMPSPEHRLGGAWAPVEASAATPVEIALAARRKPGRNRPSLTIVHNMIRLSVPAYFGPTVWTIPMNEVWVLTERPGRSGLGREERQHQVDTSLDISVVTIRVGRSESTPNLTLLFSPPQESPTLTSRLGGGVAWTIRGQLGLDRSEPLVVDGIRVRVVDAASARQILLASGARPAADRWAWAAERIGVTNDPLVVDRNRRDRRTTAWLQGFSLVAWATIFFAQFASGDPSHWILVLIVASLAAVALGSYGIRHLARSRRRRLHPLRRAR